MLEINGVDLAFDGEPVLHDIRLRIEEGSFVVVLGPSGCGKTSLLRLAAGLLQPSAGRLCDRATRRAFVFQEPRLAPWFDAMDNAAFGLKAAGMARPERHVIARDLLLRLGLHAADLGKRPAALSGGMRQRVALARALAVRPQLLLMDEPFASLDVGLRRRLQDMIVDETGPGGVTTLFVTHDVTEAVRLATRIVVLSPRPAHIVADLPNTPVLDAALAHEAAAALFGRREIADALFASAPTALDKSSSPPIGRNCLRCEKCDCTST